MDGITAPPAHVADTGYDRDFHAWSMEQARLIRTLTIPGLDSENVAEEIESLGRSDKRELLNRTTVLLAHLLKWQFQPERRGQSWRATVNEQRRAIDVILEESPSLRRTMPAVIGKAYRFARKDAAAETEIDAERFPDSCGWAAEALFQEDWFPE